MKKITLTIGHNIGNVEALDTRSIYQAATQTLNVLGFTAFDCLGMWQGMPETSTRIEIVCEDNEAGAIIASVPALTEALNQEAIMCEVADAAGVSFVEPAPRVA